MAVRVVAREAAALVLQARGTPGRVPSKSKVGAALAVDLWHVDRVGADSR